MARSLVSGSRVVRFAALAVLAALALTALGCVHVEVGDVAVAAKAPACDPVVCDVPDSDPAHPAAIRELGVPSGGVVLNGFVYVPPGAGPHPVAILLHGYPGYERNGDLAHALRRAGWVVLFFHYRGVWGSPGTFTFARAIEDAEAAVAFVSSLEFQQAHRADATRIALVGHSMGGFVALHTAARRAEVGCAASLAGANLGLMGRAAAEPASRRRLEQMLAAWSGPVRMAPRYDAVAELASNAEPFDLRGLAGPLAGRPLLLVAGARDDVTPPAQHHDPLVAAFAQPGGARLEPLVLDADHGFSSQRIALARAVVGWLGRSCR